MPPRAAAAVKATPVVLYGLDGSTYHELGKESLSCLCEGSDAIKRTVGAGVFAFITSLYPTAASNPHSGVSVPFSLRDFTTETVAKDVLASAPGQYFFNSFLLFCLDKEEEIPPLSEYVRDGRRVELGADTPLRTKHTYKLLNAPGYVPDEALPEGKRWYEIGAAILNAVLHKARLSCSYSTARNFVMLKNVKYRGFSGVNTVKLAATPGAPPLAALRQVVEDYFHEYKDTLIEALREIRKAPGKGKDPERITPPSTGPVARTAPGSSGGGATRHSARTARSPEGADAVLPAIAALSVSKGGAAGEETPPDAIRRSSRADVSPVLLFPDSEIKAAAEAADAETSAKELASEEAFLKSIDAQELQALLIAQCRILGKLNNLSSSAQKTLMASVSSAAPPARMRVEFNVLVEPSTPMSDSIKLSICPQVLVARGKESPDLRRALEEHQFELKQLESAWQSSSRMLCVSLMHGGVRAWSAMFEVREEGLQCAEAYLGLVESRYEVMMACVGGAGKEARSTLSQACFLSTLAWLGLEHEVQRVHFSSYSPYWLPMKPREVDRDCPAAGARRGAAAKWMRRKPYLFGPGKLSWMVKLRATTKAEIEDELSRIQAAGQFKLRRFYAQLVALGEGTVLDASASGLLPEGEERSVPAFGSDECLLRELLLQLESEAGAIEKELETLAAGAVSSYAHLLPARQLCMMAGHFEGCGKRQWMYALQPKAPAPADLALAQKAVPNAAVSKAEALSAASFVGLAERAREAWTVAADADDVVAKESLPWKVMTALVDDPSHGFKVLTAKETL